MAEAEKKKTGAKAAEGDVAEAGAEASAEKKALAILNPRLDIGSYTFGDGKTFEGGVRTPVTDAEYEKYSDEKYRGFQVIVKA